MNIRPATENDIVKVSRLWFDMVTELAPEMTPNITWWRLHALQFMKGPYMIFVAEEGGHIHGFADCFIFPEPSTGKYHCIGNHLFVEPESRNTAVSRMLYRSVIRFAKKKRCSIIEFFCFEKERPFWEKKGYENKPSRILMRREICLTP